MIEHGEQILDVLGSEVDRIEKEIKVQIPAMFHIFLMANYDIIKYGST